MYLAAIADGTKALTSHISVVATESRYKGALAAPWNLLFTPFFKRLSSHTLFKIF